MSVQSASSGNSGIEDFGEGREEDTSQPTTFSEFQLVFMSTYCVLATVQSTLHVLTYFSFTSVLWSICDNLYGHFREEETETQRS